MAPVTPVRSSGRQRKPTQKVVEATFLEEVLSESEDDPEQIDDLLGDAQGLVDGQASDSDADQGSSSSRSGSGDDSSDGSQRKPPAVSRAQQPLSSARSHPSQAPRAVLPKPVVKKPRSHAKPRGTYHLEGYILTSDMGQRIQFLAGPEKTERLHLLRARATFIDHPTLPRREALQYPPSHGDLTRETEATSGWDWYYVNGGQENFEERQQRPELTAQQGTDYVQQPQTALNILIGPYGRLRKHVLQPMTSAEVANLWPDSGNKARFNSRKRKGDDCIINVGRDVSALCWVPNQSGRVQYLTVATTMIMDANTDGLLNYAPGFEPNPPSKSTIQIWQYGSPDDDETLDSPVYSSNASLRTMICTDWGAARQLSWCPMPRDMRDEEASSSVTLGLLAGIWSDGYARVLDVKLAKHNDGKPVYLTFDSVAFAFRPAKSICTSLSWLSPTDIAVGMSNSYISLYSILPSPSTSTTETLVHQHTPYLTVPPQASNPGPVVSLASAYPSHPTLLASSSLSGRLGLVDLRHPTSDSLVSTRTRVAAQTIVYSPWLFSMLAPDEALQCIRSMGLRCWTNAVSVARTSQKTRPARRSQAAVHTDGTQFRQGPSNEGQLDPKQVSAETPDLGDFGYGTGALGHHCLDVGTVHPSICYGLSDGRVIVTNPLTRLLGGRKLPMWQQVIFRQEWAPPRSFPPSAIFSEVIDPGLDGSGGGKEAEEKGGTIRFTQGYRAEPVTFGKDRVHSTRMFEEQTNVVAVAWNPNLSVGGWVAVGWGSGVVRIVDVAV